MWFSGLLFLILSLIVEVYLWWKLQASLIFLSGRTCTIGGWLNTFLPRCMYLQGICSANVIFVLLLIFKSLIRLHKIWILKVYFTFFLSFFFPNFLYWIKSKNVLKWSRTWFIISIIYCYIVYTCQISLQLSIMMIFIPCFTSHWTLKT